VIGCDKHACGVEDVGGPVGVPLGAAVPDAIVGE